MKVTANLYNYPLIWEIKGLSNKAISDLIPCSMFLKPLKQKVLYLLLTKHKYWHIQPEQMNEHITCSWELSFLLLWFLGSSNLSTEAQL